MVISVQAKVEDFRPFVTLHQQIMGMFRSGMDTREIASAVKMKECEVYNIMSEVRHARA